VTEANKAVVIFRVVLVLFLLFGGLKEYGASSEVRDGRGSEPFLVFVL